MSNAKSHCRLLLSACWLALAGSGCASTPPITSSRLSPITDDAGSQPSNTVRKWTQLTHDERKAHMRDVVLPAMESHFLAHDAERFANFGCKTCHGQNARERDYAMPCPELPTLYPTGSKEQIDTVQQHREMATFMFQKVTPSMRELLHLPRYNEATGEGFSCFYCHPRGEPQ